MPSATSFFLWTTDPDADGLAAFLRALQQHLATDTDAWSANLLYIAAVRSLDVQVLALLLGDLKKLQRRRKWRLASHEELRELRPHAQRALEDAVRWRPGAVASGFLLSRVEFRGRELRVLLAAAQSSSECWALRVLSVRKVARSFSSSKKQQSEKEQELRVEVARAGIRQGMAELLRELLALNRPAVEQAADEWQRDVDSGRRRPRATAKEAEGVAGEVARGLRRRRRWQSVRLLVMERRRVEENGGESGRSWWKWKWRRREQQQRPHAVVELPEALFRLVLAFV